MRWLLSVLALVALSGCTGFRAYERGLPKRVEVKKRYDEPRPRIRVHQDRGERVHVALAQVRTLHLSRRIVYGTTEIRGEYNYNIAWQLLEVPLGLITLPALLLTVSGYYDPPQQENMQVDVLPTRLLPLYLLNPAVTMLGADIVRDPTSDEERFFSPTTESEIEVADPVPSHEVRYRWLDAEDHVVDEASGTTDRFGMVSLTVPDGATTLVVEAWDQRVVAPLVPQADDVNDTPRARSSPPPYPAPRSP